MAKNEDVQYGFFQKNINIYIPSGIKKHEDDIIKLVFIKYMNSLSIIFYN